MRVYTYESVHMYALGYMCVSLLLLLLYACKKAAHIKVAVSFSYSFSTLPSSTTMVSAKVTQKRKAPSTLSKVKSKCIILEKVMLAFASN